MIDEITNPYWQLAIAGGITLATILVAVLFGYGYGSDKTPSNFFLMNRTAGKWFIGASFATSMISAFLFIGLPGLFYSHGIGGWLYICIPIIFGIASFSWYGTRVRKLQIESGAVSPFEAISHAYGSKWIGAVSFFITAIFVVPVIAMQMVGIGRLLEPFGISYELSIIVLVLVFLVYTTFAGMKGDVITDVFQGLFMFIGILFVAYIALKLPVATNANIEEGGQVASLSLYSLPGPNGLFTIERIVSLALMMSALPIAHGHYIMRFMIAKDNRALKSAMPIAALMVFILYLAAAIIGLAGAEAVPGLESGDQLVGKLISEVDIGLVWIGVVFGGVIVACIIASALSSVDSQFLALGASAVRDLMQNLFNITLSNNGQVVASRMVMVVIGLAALILSMDPPQLIVQLAVFAASGTMALVPTFIGGACLKKRPDAKIALLSIGSGMLTFVFLIFWKGADAYGGWHPGVFALVVSTTIYCIGLLSLSSENQQSAVQKSTN